MGLPIAITIAVAGLSLRRRQNLHPEPTVEFLLRSHVLLRDHLFLVERVGDQGIKFSYLRLAFPVRHQGIDQVANLANIKIV